MQIIAKDHTLPRTITVSLNNDGDAFAPVRKLSAKSHPEDDPARTYEPLPYDPPGIYAVVMDLNYEARYAIYRQFSPWVGHLKKKRTQPSSRITTG